MINLLGLLVLSILSVPALAAERPLITVKGEAVTEVTPDFVKVGVVVSALEKTIDGAKADVDTRARSLLSAIEAFGIEGNDMESSGVEVTRRYEYDRNENDRFVGYEVSRSLQVKVRDLSSYEPFVEALARSGASEINAPEVDVDDKHLLKTLALKEATLNAKRKAMEIADGLGVEIGRPFEIGEERLPSQMPFSQRRARGNEIEEVVVTASRSGIREPLLFVPENIRVSATVWVSFEIEGPSGNSAAKQSAEPGG